MDANKPTEKRYLQDGSRQKEVKSLTPSISSLIVLLLFAEILLRYSLQKGFANEADGIGPNECSAAFARAPESGAEGQSAVLRLSHDEVRKLVNSQQHVEILVFQGVTGPHRVVPTPETVNKMRFFLIQFYENNSACGVLDMPAR